MIPTQVQLTELQVKGLRDASAATGRSIADLIRQAVDQYLVKRAEQIQRAISEAM